MAWNSLRSSYDAVALAYEDKFASELDAKARDRELLEAFAVTVGDPVLDVGCGPGQVGAYVRRHGRRVLGMDLSHEMSRLASRRLDGAVGADMRSLPIATGAIGGVLAFYAIIHLRRSELAAAMAEIVRVLRPGGSVLIAAHEGSGEVEHDEFLGARVPFAATLFELAELIALAEAAGLGVTLAERRTPYRTEGPTVRLYVQAVKGA